MTTLLIVFICHNNETILNTRIKYPDSTIFFVGSSDVSQPDSKIIISRDLAINIEDKPKLLTFTAWYAISKNQLFQEYDYICLFEYDVNLEPNFEEKLKNTIQNETELPDVISFFKIERYFFWDINPHLFYHFLNNKKAKYDICNEWYNTTNHCMKREILDEFVNWYYPSCIDLWLLDRKMISWYHERFFSVFMKIHNKRHIGVSGVDHCQDGSHTHMNPQTEKEFSKELMDLYYKDPNDLETLAKIEAYYSEST